MHIPYAIGAYLVFALLLPILLLHPKLRHGWGRRMGLYPAEFPNEGGSLSPSASREPPGDEDAAGAAPRIWFHGASAGHLSALSPMIREVRERRPDATLIVSCLTNSGAMMARSRLTYVDGITYLPWDLPGATRRAVESIRPDLLVLQYTEIWPNLIRAARARGSRIVLVNGHFSERSLRWYKLLFALSGRPLAALDLLLMRSDEEAERALLLGASPGRVRVTGNTEADTFGLPDDRCPAELSRAFGLDPSAPVLVAGSTHEGEEPILLAVYRRLLETVPSMRLILAPRYIERVGKVVAAVERAGFRARLRSAGMEQGRVGSPGSIPTAERAGEGGFADTSVGVLDTIGELETCYRLATVVFVGGSFTSRGGQSIFEPAAQGRPVVFGPNMTKFRDSVQVLVGRGGIQVADGEKLHKVLGELLHRPDKLRELGELAGTTVRSLRGAGSRNVEAMLGLIDEGVSSVGGASAHARGSG